MTGKLIAVVNRKGGVGKTTLAVALARTIIWEERASVLLLDLDPQASASEALTTETQYSDRIIAERDIASLLNARINQQQLPTWRDCSVGPVHGLLERAAVEMRVTLNSSRLWEVERNAFIGNRHGHLVEEINNLTKILKSEFDYIICDCPPGWTLSSETVLKSADFILCPVNPTRLAVWGMQAMQDYLTSISSASGLRPWRYVINRYRANLVEHQQHMAAISTRFSNRMLSHITPGHAAAGETIIIPELVAMVNAMTDPLEIINVAHPRTLAAMYSDQIAQVLFRMWIRVKSFLDEGDGNV